MRNICLALFILTCLFVTSAMAGHPVAKTVAEAKVSAVGTDVSLTGHFVKKINDDSYLFTDGSDEVLIHVNNDEMTNEVMSSDVTVSGQIVQDFMYTEVRADAVSLRN